MNERVTITIDNHVAEVMLDRADKYNALDSAMFEAIAEAGESLRDNQEVRAVILYGAGEHFCSGLDVASMGNLAGDDNDFNTVGMRKVYNSDSNVFQRVATVWHDLDVPVIAAIKGVCYGGGIQIALGTDIRYAHPESKMSVMEIKWGLIPDMGISQMLRKLVRIDVAKELLYTGRVLDAQAALELGLVTAVADDPLAHARSMAAEIVNKSPDAVRRCKRLLEASWDMQRLEGLELEAKLQGEVIFKENQLEAVTANFEKRAPAFK